MKPKNYIVGKFKNGMHYLVLDVATVQKFLSKENNRVKCIISGIEFHCAILRGKEVGHFINIASSVCKRLNLKVGDKVQAAFKQDNTEYQFEMPLEFKEVLDTDPVASKIFHSLTKGNQRSLIYLVSQVKSIDKRIERSLKIANQIKMGINSPKLILK